MVEKWEEVPEVFGLTRRNISNLCLTTYLDLTSRDCWVIDLLPVLKGKEDVASCYFKEVDHLNEYGEEVVANIIYPLIKVAVANLTRSDREGRR